MGPPKMYCGKAIINKYVSSLVLRKLAIVAEVLIVGSRLLALQQRKHACTELALTRTIYATG